ncbi:hypothetical protein GH714_036913 [Hevea brasiliensis]|uniref:non-specific serine/threonine protein kinase n=1 Tax=Hevea brasiliensis TaxID=3981 RepID=A0A6A6KFC8_HEVBR|nr:hypothetical protein GH714_036913 [Hevea brasiliensis]
MSKMKHLLRKLHIGGAIDDHQRLAETRPVANPSPTATANPLSSSSSSPTGRITAVESAGGDRMAAGTGLVWILIYWKRFQVQLALAISASDPNTREDPDSAQIDAAKRISLGCPVAPLTVTDSPVESLSLRYWYALVGLCFRVVFCGNQAFDTARVIPLMLAEKLMQSPHFLHIVAVKLIDGWLYDVCGITSNSVIQVQGKMPLLVDLQAITILDNVDYEVVFVNRFVDPELRELERKAYIMSLQCQVSDSLLLSGLVQKLADLVVDRMGGPVGDADEMSTRWTRRCCELRSALNSVILPLGCLDVGLSRHRALLFKVLADKINLPCMLVKGSYYSGTDDGAVNLIKINNESEYIIDLMGAPGTLIPAEVPSSHLPSTGFDVRGFADLTGIPTESGASPPSDSFSDMNQQDFSEQKCLIPLTTKDPLNNLRCDTKQGWPAEGPAKQQRETEMNFLKSEVSFPSDTKSEGFIVDDRTSGQLQIGAIRVETVSDNQPGMLGNQIHESFLSSAVNSCQLQPENFLVCDDKQSVKLVETFDSGLHISCNGYSERIQPVLGEVAEWEIPWEDLQIGERIGSYGEVYHGDWNGTEVAVKKFLDQDLSGDALVQFKCEAEIMLRLRHPNVVLFMGAVTRPPHLSILTEFLPRGSLYRFLHRPNPQLDEKRRMRMALDVAKGMNYLHTSHPPIVHRDLKSPNLLVDKNWIVKVCDFGMSRMKHHTFLSSKSTAGTPEWMAPEVLRNELANEKCDVYSFGVILWELATCQIPWKGLNPMQVVGAVGFQNKRLEIPEDVDPAIAQIIHDCWQREPHLRPSFSQLISRLRHIQKLRVERT